MTIGAPCSVPREKISGLTISAHDCAERFCARLSLIEYGPDPGVIA